MKLLIIKLFVIVFMGVASASPFTHQNIKSNQVNIVAFLTSWCPVCINVENFLIDFSKKQNNINISIVYIDENKQNPLKNSNLNYYFLTYSDSKEFGVDKSVPYILILDKDSKIVKKYHTFNKELLGRLVINLSNGIYENGTLPPSQRVNLWQIKRY